MQNRYLTHYILSDLKEKMVFIGGPRQVGKTTLAKKNIGKKFSTQYYNWDNLSHKKQILSDAWPSEVKLIIFDEIHKYKKWKSFVKGEFDVYKNRYSFLITGSARLDLYRKKNDSLQGRYHYYRLHPFSLGELCEFDNKIIPFEELCFHKQKIAVFQSLFEFGG